MVLWERGGGGGVLGRRGARNGQRDLREIGKAQKKARSGREKSGHGI